MKDRKKKEAYSTVMPLSVRYVKPVNMYGMGILLREGCLFFYVIKYCYMDHQDWLHAGVMGLLHYYLNRKIGFIASLLKVKSHKIKTLYGSMCEQNALVGVSTKV